MRIDGDGRAAEEKPSSDHGAVKTQISDGIVALLKEHYAPERAKTYYFDNLVVCILGGGFTRIEQTLLNAGRRQAVMDQRMAFQEVMVERFKTLVQRATGRKVSASCPAIRSRPT